MTQNNMRTEPSFGNSVISEETAGYLEKMAQEATPYISLRSSQSPGHTFTPVMKRPEELEVRVEEQPTVTTETLEEPLEVPLADIIVPDVNTTTKEFAFTPIADTTVENKENEVTLSPKPITLNTESSVEIEKEVDEPITKVESFNTERIIPNMATATAGAALAATAISKTKGSAQIPPRTRRLLFVSLLALVCFVLFLLLKPNELETVEQLQSQQGSSLPIEFRPVDEAEAKRAEEQARAEQEAAKLQQEQEAQAALQAQQQAQQNTNTQQVTTPAQEPAVSQPQTQSVVEQPVVKPVERKPVENKPVVAQPVVKPQTQGSVVYQPETPAKPQPKVAPQQPKEAAKVTKPAVEKAPAKVEVETPKAAPVAATKTMTVPKGVSLMQVFRDNNLNISDVNAMSKVNNVVSNLKVGERVTVRLDKNNRVVEMSIGSGGKFTRQANGSYTFK